jgi:hypothetical protein
MMMMLSDGIGEDGLLDPIWILAKQREREG